MTPFVIEDDVGFDQPLEVLRQPFDLLFGMHPDPLRDIAVPDTERHLHRFFAPS
jgi:hypothetical protein